MKRIGLMVGASFLSWLIVMRVVGAAASPEVLYGMLAPLAVAAVSWRVTERTYRSCPERLTGMMATGLAIKLALFGTYVVVMIRVVGLRPAPFAASFVGYFIVLHLMEALFIRRLVNS